MKLDSGVTDSHDLWAEFAAGHRAVTGHSGQSERAHVESAFE